jgi:predicted thioesterase
VAEVSLQEAVGAVGTAQTVVTRELTVAHFHEDMPEVYGTPFMIYLMEVAAADALRPHLPPGAISVGIAVDVRHLAATPIGLTVTATAEVLAVEGRTARFAVRAHDGVETIGVGEHVRAVVDPARLRPKMAAKRQRVGAA